MTPREWHLEALVEACRAQDRDVLYCAELAPRMGQPIAFEGPVFSTAEEA